MKTKVSTKIAISFLIMVMCMSALLCCGVAESEQKSSYGISIAKTSCELDGIIYYVDFENTFRLSAYDTLTGESVSFCKDPSCLHNDECPERVLCDQSYYITTDGYALYMISYVVSKGSKAVLRYDPMDGILDELAIIEHMGGMVSKIAVDTEKNGSVYYSELYLDDGTEYYRICQIPKQGGQPTVVVEKQSENQSFSVYENQLIYPELESLVFFNTEDGTIQRKDSLGGGNFIVFNGLMYFYLPLSGEAFKDTYNAYGLGVYDPKTDQMTPIVTDCIVTDAFCSAEGIAYIRDLNEYLYTREAFPGEYGETVDVYRMNYGEYIVYDPLNDTSEEVVVDDNCCISEIRGICKNQFLGHFTMLTEDGMIDYARNGYYGWNSETGVMKSLSSDGT